MSGPWWATGNECSIRQNKLLSNRKEVPWSGIGYPFPGPYIKETSLKVRTDHDAFSQGPSCKGLNRILMKWSLRLSEVDFDVLYCPELVHQVQNGLSRVLHPSYTQDCELVDDDVLTFESSPPALEQPLNERGLLGTFLWKILLRPTNSLVLRSEAVSHTLVGESSYGDSREQIGYSKSTWLRRIMMAFPLTTLELLATRKYNLSCQLILATKASDHSSVLFRGTIKYCAVETHQ